VASLESTPTAWCHNTAGHNVGKTNAPAPSNSSTIHHGDTAAVCLPVTASLAVCYCNLEPPVWHHASGPQPEVLPERSSLQSPLLVAVQLIMSNQPLAEQTARLPVPVGDSASGYAARAATLAGPGVRATGTALATRIIIAKCAAAATS
jgi:hypothetical protein